MFDKHGINVLRGFWLCSPRARHTLVRNHFVRIVISVMYYYLSKPVAEGLEVNVYRLLVF
uniref:Uncharacterized protein n=1 Tax=Arundo donax TaxID=35708 RepID=A0A0A9B6L6_ARUDO